MTSLLSYTRPERLSGDNKYFCDRCQEKQDALRSQTLRALPPVLIFSLNRWAVGRTVGRTVWFAVWRTVQYAVQQGSSMLSMSSRTLCSIYYGVRCAILQSSVQCVIQYVVQYVVQYLVQYVVQYTGRCNMACSTEWYTHSSMPCGPCSIAYSSVSFKRCTVCRTAVVYHAV